MSCSIAPDLGVHGVLPGRAQVGDARQLLERLLDSSARARMLRLVLRAQDVSFPAAPARSTPDGTPLLRSDPSAAIITGKSRSRKVNGVFSSAGLSARCSR